MIDTEIEERNPNEVLYFGECRVAPGETEVENPSFDIVLSDLITGIITEEGILSHFNLISEKCIAIPFIGIVIYLFQNLK